MNKKIVIVGVLVGLALSGAGSELLLCKPYMQNIGPHGCTIACETSREEPSLRLKWADGEIPFRFTRFDLSGTYLAVARIDGLKPGTAVSWEVEGRKGSFTTWRDDGRGFKCAVFGDYQGGTWKGAGRDWEANPCLCGERMFRDMVEVEKCEFAVGTGDVADAGDYEKDMRPLILDRLCGVLGSRIPFFMAFGNHDTKHPQNHFFFVNPRPEGAYGVESFSFMRDNCLFVCIDDAEGGVDEQPTKPATRRWLESVLRSEAARKAKFRFVFRHVPMFEEDFGNCDRSNIELFAECGVDCVFSGDHHGYARLERGGVRQVVNGCMGYFDHDRPGCHIGCNWYGKETLVGGHSPALTNRTWRFQKPGCPGVLGPETPINRGLFPGYATLEVRGDTATFRIIGFNADGSKIGLMDSFEMKAGVRPPCRRGMAIERYARDKANWSKAYILTGKGGAVLELDEEGARLKRFRKPDGKGVLVGSKVESAYDLPHGFGEGIWGSKPIVDEESGTVGVMFISKQSSSSVTYLLMADNTVEVRK